MFDSGTVLIALIAVVITLVVVRYIKARRPVPNYPPGPVGLPIVGSLPQFLGREDYHRYFMELGEKYGSVCSYMFGHQSFVLVNGIDSIKEALVTRGNDIADRPENYVVTLYNPHQLGLFDARFNDIWFNQRHFAHKTLRGFGFGKTSFESKIMEEVEFLIKNFKATQQKPTDIRNFITNCVSNIICSITFGKRYNHFEDPEFLKAMTCLRDWFTTTSSLMLQLGHVYPIIRPLLWKQARDVKNATGSLEKFLLGEIAKKEEKLDTISEPGDFVESYLLELKKDTEGKFKKLYLKHDIMDIFAAGTETTSTTLTWSVLYMMVHPEVQRKVQKELDQVVGREKLPSWANKSDLPYTEATLLEIQRLSSLVPVVPHATLKPTTLGGYNLPAKCDVWLNLWSIHHDPKLYPDPEKFDPNRFLTEDGQVKKQESFMPFGAGRRVCMGESLAKLELFLFFSAMLHQFSFSVPEGTVAPSLEGDLGITIMPKPFEVVITERS
ncbi:Cytochrome P450 2U1 [Holothuria leucospilota]|uniref:Steroid 21-hydroxylase n=1 Tax=Holothuria leucospilota TaxID=206669 RepID=A0A9Q0YDK5_HOLLE|nr:Cytochrome P450 2U1 [Holothuria leucospilota]